MRVRVQIRVCLRVCMSMRVRVRVRVRLPASMCERVRVWSHKYARVRPSVREHACGHGRDGSCDCEMRLRLRESY